MNQREAPASQPPIGAMKSILIVGAGAVGRGFVAPLFATRRVAVDFVDADPELVGRLRRRNSYLTAVAKAQGHELIQVVYRRVFSSPEGVEAGSYDAVFVCTGVRQFLTCAGLVRGARAAYVLENLRSAPVQLRALAGHDRIWFGIPDVIVSCTAPPELLGRDPLCVVAESGDLVLERDARPMESSAGLIWAEPSELERRWACKLFIHNAAHAVAAFLGTLAGHDFVHQAMADDRICAVVEKAIRTLTCAIIARGLADGASATAYMERELRRFRNVLLHDPIRRVARDPLRKLGAEDRLMQGLRLVLAARQDPGPMVTGIAAGLLCHAREAGRSSTSAADLETLLRHDCALLNEGLIRVIVHRAQRLQNQYRSWPHEPPGHDLNQDHERAQISVRTLVA